MLEIGPRVPAAPKRTIGSKFDAASGLFTVPFESTYASPVSAKTLTMQPMMNT